MGRDAALIGIPLQERSRTAPGTAEDAGRDTKRDDEVLVLRDQGKSFAGIARELGFEGALWANSAFNRALRRRPRLEQERLRSREVAMLDALAERVRCRGDLSEEEIARRMRSLHRLRKSLFIA
jgi:hypothetical protein